MGSFIQVIKFLPVNTDLMVLVRPVDDIAQHVQQSLIKGLQNFPYKQGTSAAPLKLKEDLRIKFWISSKWRLRKELEPCECTSPLLPDRKLQTLNQAYQEISALIETSRKSRGGTVYANVYFLDTDNLWKPIEIKRNLVYKPFEEFYDAKIRVYRDRTVAYVKTPPNINDFYGHLSTRRDDLLRILTDKKLESQLFSLNAIIQEAKLSAYQLKLKELEMRLDQEFPETSGHDSWQTWVYQNNWLFAVQYNEPLPKEHVGFNNIPDFLFPTLDGFIDVLEIKRPSSSVIETDRSHPGAYRWSSQANEAIGQVVNYLQEIESHQLEITRRLEDRHSLQLSAIKPRGVILIGTTKGWKREQREALRKLNATLQNIQVITYSDLLLRGNKLVKFYADASK